MPVKNNKKDLLKKADSLFKDMGELSQRAADFINEKQNDIKKAAKEQAQTEMTMAEVHEFLKSISVDGDKKVEGIREEMNKKYEEVKDILEKIKKSANKEVVKRGAFLSKQLQKYNYPKDKKGQLSLFNTLEKRTQNKILGAGVSIEFVNRTGDSLPLNKGHYKLIDCLTELLHEKSSDKNHYDGNEIGKQIIFGGVNTKAPALLLKLYEIAKKYNQGKHPSGKHIEIVKNLINDLAYKPEYLALIRYERKTKTNKNTILKRKIEEYAPLFRLLDTSYEEYNLEETKLLNKASEVVLLLNPVFTDQINQIWVGYPMDLVSRSLSAYGSSNPPEIFYRLRDYLADNRSRNLKNPRFANKDYIEIPINEERLFYLIAENYMKSSRKSLIKKYLKTSLDAVLKLGLLKSWKLTTAATGEPKYIFKIEKDWI